MGKWETVVCALRPSAVWKVCGRQNRKSVERAVAVECAQRDVSIGAMLVPKKSVSRLQENS